MFDKTATVFVLFLLFLNDSMYKLLCDMKNNL